MAVLQGEHTIRNRDGARSRRAHTASLERWEERDRRLLLQRVWLEQQGDGQVLHLLSRMIVIRIRVRGDAPCRIHREQQHRQSSLLNLVRLALLVRLQDLWICAHFIQHIL